MIRDAVNSARGSRDAAWLGLAIALSIGGLARFWNLTGPSLHTDEAYTFSVSALPLSQLVHTIVSSDFHPPLFYLITHYLMAWLRWPLWNYRFFTAAFGCVGILATWGAARRLFGSTAAVVASLVVALEPGLLQYDRMYRMYAVTVAMATVSWWLLLEAEHAIGSRRAFLSVGYLLSLVAMVYVDYLGALVVFCQVAYALTRWRKDWFVPAAAGVGVLSFLPWFGALRSQLPLGGLALSTPALDEGLWRSVRGAFAAGMPDNWLPVMHGDFIVSVCVFGIIGTAAWLGRRTALPFWLGLLVVQVALSLVTKKNLAYFPRYLLIDVPGFAIGVGLIINTLAHSRARVAAVAAALATAAALAVTSSNVLFDPYYQFPDWYGVNALMLRSEKPGDAIVLDAGYEQLVVHSYSAFRSRTMLVFMNPHDFAPILSWIGRHPAARIWYVQHQNFYWDPDQRIAAELGRSRDRVLSRSWPRQSPVDLVSVALFDAAPIKKIR